MCTHLLRLGRGRESRPYRFCEREFNSYMRAADLVHQMRVSGRWDQALVGQMLPYGASWGGRGGYHQILSHPS